MSIVVGNMEKTIREILAALQAVHHSTQHQSRFLFAKFGVNKKFNTAEQLILSV